MRMCYCKDIALIALGMISVLAYQKYSKPVMEKAEVLMKDVLEKADEKLDDMM